MRLTDYLAEQGISESEFARRTGLAQRTVNRICKGSGARTGTAWKIVRATGGLVTLEDLLPESEEDCEGSGAAA